MALHTVSLCSGVGGLDLGVALAVEDVRPVCYVEREAFAAAALVARMEEAALGRAPIWDDLLTFDPGPWAGLVDLVTAGFPCPPFSQAGQRKGAEDFRYLWPDVLRVIRGVGPSLVYLENVAGFVAHPDGLRRVVGDLAEAGFDAEWDCYVTTETGGTQERERVFVLAYRDDCRRPIFRWDVRGDGDPQSGDHADRSCRAPLAFAGGELPERRRGTGDVARSSGAAQGEGHQRERRGDASGDRGEAVARTNGRGGLQRAGVAHDARGAEQPAHAGVVVADPDGAGLPADPVAGDSADPVGSGEAWPGRRGLPLWPPPPDDSDGWRAVLGRSPGLEPSVRRVADGLADRLDRLHATGNGVVPLVAALALVELADTAGLITYEKEALSA